MSFIAAVLILNLEEADAFIAFANLLNKPCQLAFFRVDHGMVWTLTIDRLAQMCLCSECLLRVKNTEDWDSLIKSMKFSLSDNFRKTWSDSKESLIKFAIKVKEFSFCSRLFCNFIDFFPIYRCWSILQHLRYSLRKTCPNYFFISSHTVLHQIYTW